ncbi:MAG: glycosyltransferase family 4 protein [bacterium]|nr:glycosyltransferase family 4 protein [bacterium]
MKILFLNYEYPPLGGGAGNATAYLLKEYAKIPGLEVHLVTSSVDGDYHHFPAGDRIMVHSVPIGKNTQNLHHQSVKDLLVYSFKGYRFAHTLLQREKFDVIHAFFSVPCGYMAKRLSKRYNIPYIVSLRGADVPGFSERFFLLYTLLKPLIRRVWRQAYRVVAASEGLKELALKTNEKQAMDVIYNGVSVDDFFPDISKQPHDKFVITLGATRITARKGIAYLIRVVAKLAPKYPKIFLEVMGSGNDRERLEGIVRELHLENNVRFLGRIPREQTFSYYQKAHLFVLPSLNEGMSNAMLEALASGLPIVTTETGGAKELVEEGVNGCMVKMKDADDLAEKLELFMSDEALRVRFGQASRKRAEALSWKNVATDYHHLYQEAIQK